MDLTAPEVACELVDLTGVTLAGLGSLDAAVLDRATDTLLDTERRPTLGASSENVGANCMAEPETGSRG
ncbi:hypothetical protein SAMN05216223_102386 [Actinacidiphila yanglinensis]|uniref:FXSXX-COOH protein n=1 Tax=Actinacidiphila yanglinensis TaxID=310779 RepID=A0A1H5VQX4_9ACTN|nr:hypothetical protein [Actinacidiphila yanglinensis]SEF89231.1 hypothetical protein SAMN05216223_102386 [Actinacidiphila yanglinensis]